MTQDALDFVQWFFEYIWYFFNSWNIPGTNMTPAALGFFCLFVILFVPWFKKFFNNL